MDNPGNNQHFNVLIWVGGGGSKNEYSLYYWENVDNCERPLRLGTILGRFSVIYFRGLGLRIRVRV